MNREILRRAGLLALFLLSGFAAPLRAQDEQSAEAHHRNQCRLAAQVLRTGQPAPKREWARNYITTCREEGPAILAENWRTTPADTGQLRYLVINTGRLRDERLYSALRAVALDRSRPSLVRIGAMLALGRYVDSHSAVWFSDLRPPEGPVRRIPLVTSWSTNGNQLAGSQPVSGAVARPVLELLEEVAARRETEPREVWYAAAVLARRVKADIDYGRAR